MFCLGETATARRAAMAHSLLRTMLLLAHVLALPNERDKPSQIT